VINGLTKSESELIDIDNMKVYVPFSPEVLIVTVTPEMRGTLMQWRRKVMDDL